MNVELVIIMRKIDKHFFRHSMPVPVDLSERTVRMCLSHLRQLQRSKGETHAE